MAKKKKDLEEDEKYSADDLVIGDEEDDDFDDDEDVDDDDDDDEDVDEDEDEDEDEDLDEDEAEDVDEDVDENEDEFEDAEFAGADGEDPYWWTPHVVLGGLLLIGLLGFFGLFNEILSPIAAHPVSDAPAASATAVAAVPSATPTPVKTVKVPTRRDRAAAAQGEILGAKHILVQWKGSTRADPKKVTRTKDAAKKRAEAAQKKAAKSKTDPKRDDAWRKLVEEYSDEPGAAKRGGDLGKFKPGSFHPDFVAGTKKIKVGDVSGLVESPFGYHIIWRTQ
jgi:parvulin-like peptidyl-prolyl isomerase